jgi:DNA-binding PadR family transcriptional regulator
MERTLNNWWPRARSKLYEEPKKLVAHGLATAKTDRVGKRPRTIYTITVRGRRALAAWLKVPGEGPSLESEQLTKLLYAEHGTKADALGTIDAARRWAVGELAVFADEARPYLSNEGPFPARVAVNMIVGRFMLDFYTLVYTWALWAEERVDAWPDGIDGAQPEWSVMEDIVRTGDDVRRAEGARSKARRPA